MKPEPSIFDEVDEEFEARREAEGLADADAGRVVPHEEVAAWLETWGTPDETPAPAKWFGMTLPDPVEPIGVRFEDDAMWVELVDGRVLGVSLAWFPRLLHATQEQRLDFELSMSGIHWDALDEDISTAGLLAGRGDMTRPKKGVA